VMIRYFAPVSPKQKLAKNKSRTKIVFLFITFS
jgi:hypothetical protein